MTIIHDIYHTYYYLDIGNFDYVNSSTVERFYIK